MTATSRRELGVVGAQDPAEPAAAVLAHDLVAAGVAVLQRRRRARLLRPPAHAVLAAAGAGPGRRRGVAGRCQRAGRRRGRGIVAVAARTIPLAVGSGVTGQHRGPDTRARFSRFKGGLAIRCWQLSIAGTHRGRGTMKQSRAGTARARATRSSASIPPGKARRGEAGNRPFTDRDRQTGGAGDRPGSGSIDRSLDSRRDVDASASHLGCHAGQAVTHDVPVAGHRGQRRARRRRRPSPTSATSPASASAEPG